MSLYILMMLYGNLTEIYPNRLVSVITVIIDIAYKKTKWAVL